jgi:hypothetical protein
MAPEQFKGDPVGPEADIFAWGATMVFAATGTLPFGDGSVPSVMYKILTEQPDLGGLSGPMRDLVTECLAKDPAARPTARQIVDRLMSAGNVEEPAAAPVPPAGDSMPGGGAALYTIDPLHNVPMRQPAAGPTVSAGLRTRPRVARTAIIGVIAVIVIAGGVVGGLKAFGSASPHGAAASVVTHTHSQPGARALSGANGSTSTSRYASLDALGSGSLAAAGATSGVPYFEPVKGDWDALDGIQRCQTIGSDRTTEGVICVGLLEGNSGGGITWYTPDLTAYCETISTGKDVRCAKITGEFGMYSVTGVQEAPREYGSCERSCSSGTNVFVDTNGSAWMTVNTAAASSCRTNGGAGTDCEIYPYAYAGLVIELPGTDTNVTLAASAKGPNAIGY